MTKPHTANPPSHIVWFVPEREGAPWTRIGALWPTKNGRGFKLTQDMHPLAAGSVLVMPNEPKAEGEPDAAGGADKYAPLRHTA